MPLKRSMSEKHEDPEEGEVGLRAWSIKLKGENRKAFKPIKLEILPNEIHQGAGRGGLIAGEKHIKPTVRSKGLESEGLAGTRKPVPAELCFIGGLKTQKTW